MNRLVDTKEKNKNEKKTIHKYWQEKSKDGIASGTIDLIADQLEQKAILEEINGNEQILEIGCGDGRNSINIRKEHNNVLIDAFDFSEGMIDLAKENVKNEGIKDINYFIYDIDSIDKLDEKYDLIISKRALINLKSYENQINAIENIAGLLNDNGIYLMCENSLNGLNNINKARMSLSLPKIEMPWHNRYIDEIKLENDIKRLTLIKKKNFSSLYYFLSRIVNAYFSMATNTQPMYDSDINKIALKLDEEFVDIYSQGVLWVWKKT